MWEVFQRSPILLCSSSPADVIFSLFLQWPKELEVHTLIWSRHREKEKLFKKEESDDMFRKREKTKNHLVWGLTLIKVKS